MWHKEILSLKLTLQHIYKFQVPIQPIQHKIYTEEFFKRDIQNQIMNILKIKRKKGYE